MPLSTEQESQFSVELMVLSAAMHGAGPSGPQVLAALLHRLENTEPEEANTYADLALLLPEAGRQRLEAMMTAGTQEYRSDFARRYYRPGKAKGEINGTRRMLLAVLAARGIELPEQAVTSVEECGDVARLEAWVRRAATAERLEDIFPQ